MPCVLHNTCTYLAVLTGFSISLTATIAALSAPRAVYMIACVMPCLATILYFWHCLLCICLIFILLSLPCIRFFAFYVWYHVMLLTLKKDNTTCSLYLCCLLHMPNMIIKSGVICIVSIYTQFLCIQMTWQYICVYVCYWLHVQQLQYRVYIWYTSILQINIILLFVFHNIRTVSHRIH